MTSENAIDIDVAGAKARIPTGKHEDAPLYGRLTEEKPHQGVPRKCGTDKPYL